MVTKPIEQVTEPDTEPVHPGQDETGLATATEPDPDEPADPEIRELWRRLLDALLEEEAILDARVEMGVPIYAEARLKADSVDTLSLAFFSRVFRANPGWGWDESYATEAEKLYQEMVLTLMAPSGAVYQYHYHDEIWDAVNWPEGEFPFSPCYGTPRLLNDVKESGAIVEGEELFNKEDFYAIYRELGLESDGLLPDAPGVLERLGPPERVFLRHESDPFADTFLYLGYPFGEVFFRDTTLIRLTNDSVVGPRGTRVGDHYEDVIAKFWQDENRDDGDLYDFVPEFTPYEILPIAYGRIEDDYQNTVYGIHYANGHCWLRYYVENDLVTSIDLHFWLYPA
jgi:hypothetical protein